MTSVQELLGKVRPRIQRNPQPNQLVPHVYSFASLYNTAWRLYSGRGDEAVRHVPSNALAMRHDAFIEALILERITPLALHPWSIWVPKPNDTYQKYVASCLTQAIQAIPRFNSMRLYLGEAVWYGRQGSQVNRVQKLIDGKPYWTVGEHRPVNGDKIYHAWDGTPMVAINPLAAGAYPQELVTDLGEPVTARSDRGMTLLRLARPEYRTQFVMHRHIVTDADYFEPEKGVFIYGRGLRDQVYWAWNLRTEMLGWATDFMQKVGTLGLLIFLYEDGNKSAEEAAEDAAEKSSIETALTMPLPPGQNTKQANAVQHIPANEAGIMALRGMIEDYWDKYIERLFVGQPSSGGTSGNGFGGSAGAALHAQTKYDILRWDAQNLDETLTLDLVEPLVRLNHSDVDFPVKFVSAVEHPESAAKLQAAQTIHEMGVDLEASELRGLGGFSKPDPVNGEVVKGGSSSPAPGDGFPFGGKGDPEKAGKGEQTKPGQGVDADSAVARETGQYADLAAYADDGSVFAPWVDDPEGIKVTLARLGAEAAGQSVLLPWGADWVEALVRADPKLPRAEASRLVRRIDLRKGR